MTNEEARAASELFSRIGAKSGVIVDPIGPIRMKSRTEWLEGTQAAPNYRGVLPFASDPELVASLLTRGAAGIDVLYICDAEFSERVKDPAVLANLRKARFLVVQSWDANHPLNELADVLIPGTIHAEKEGTFTNLQGTVQEIHEAYPPKGQAVSEREVFRRIAQRLFTERAVAAQA